VTIDHSALVRACAFPLEWLAPFCNSKLATLCREQLELERAIDTDRATLHASVTEALDQPLPFSLLQAVRIARKHMAGYEPWPWVGPLAPELADRHALLCGRLSTTQSMRMKWTQVGMQFRDELARTVENQRTELRRMAAQQEFQCALLLATPQLWPRLVRWLARLIRNNHSDRQMERTLLRYLLRAAGRPTPNGLWAGAVPLRLDRNAEGIQVASDARCHVSLSAQIPLRVLLQMRRRVQPSDTPVVVNPLITTNADTCRWEAWLGESWTSASVELTPLLRKIIDWFACNGATPFCDACEQILAELGLPRPEVEAALHELLSCDLLRPAWALPAKAYDSDDFTDAVAATLVPQDRKYWNRRWSTMSSLCNELAKSCDASAPDRLAVTLDKLRNEAIGLWQDLGLEGEPPDPVAYIDRRLPDTWITSQPTCSRVLNLVRAWLAFHAGDGTAELYRRATAALFRDADGVPLTTILSYSEHAERPSADHLAASSAKSAARQGTLAAIFHRFEDVSGIAALVEDRERELATWLASKRDQATAPLVPRCSPSPLSVPLTGSLLLGLGPGDTLFWRLARPEPGAFDARLRIAVDSDRLSKGSLSPSAFGLAKQIAPRRPLELFGFAQSNFHAACGAPLSEWVLNPDSPLSFPAGQLSITWDAGTEAVWLRDQEGRYYRPVHGSASAPLPLRRSAWLPYLMHQTHGWEYLSFGLPLLPDEFAGVSLPRLTVPDSDDTLHRRRWILLGSELEVWRTLPARERFARWMRWAVIKGVPPWIGLCRMPLDDEWYCPVSSPLVLEAMMTGLSDPPCDWVVYEAPEPEACQAIRDHAGRHYLADLAINWFAEPHAA
jgi:Lantibiotic dehydratase, N terminus